MLPDVREPNDSGSQSKEVLTNLCLRSSVQRKWTHAVCLHCHARAWQVNWLSLKLLVTLSCESKWFLSLPAPNSYLGRAFCLLRGVFCCQRLRVIPSGVTLVGSWTNYTCLFLFVTGPSSTASWPIGHAGHLSESQWRLHGKPSLAFSEIERAHRSQAVPSDV